VRYRKFVALRLAGVGALVPELVFLVLGFRESVSVGWAVAASVAPHGCCGGAIWHRDRNGHLTAELRSGRYHPCLDCRKVRTPKNVDDPSAADPDVPDGFHLRASRATIPPGGTVLGVLTLFDANSYQR
jgi:hypothetical protein